MKQSQEILLGGFMSSVVAESSGVYFRADSAAAAAGAPSAMVWDQAPGSSPAQEGVGPGGARPLPRAASGVPALASTSRSQPGLQGPQVHPL